MNIKALALGLLLAASAPAFAADVDGKWTGSIDTPNGAVEVNYTFKAEESTLTGAATARALAMSNSNPNAQAASERDSIGRTASRACILWWLSVKIQAADRLRPGGSA